MNSPPSVEFCPTRANLHWSQYPQEVQFADFSSLQVAQYEEVKYFQPSDSDKEDGVDADDDGKSLCVQEGQRKDLMLMCYIHPLRRGQQAGRLGHLN